MSDIGEKRTVRRVLLERRKSAVVWVDAPTDSEAEEVAWELVEEADWQVDDEEVIDTEALTPPAGQRYWTGGPAGHWVDDSGRPT